MTPEMLSLSNSPGLFVGLMLLKLIVVFSVVMLMVAYATWCERKIIGHMQTRLGPMRTGWHGLLQPIADGIKLFFKEDIIPSQASVVPFLLAPMMILVPAIITVAVIPFGPDVTVSGLIVPLQITDLNVGVLYILAFAGLGVYGIVLAGWSSNSKYSLLGGVRASAQMISYELAAGLTIVSVFMLSETLSLREIVALQSEPLWGTFSFLPNWYVFTQPLAFFLFVITGLAEINRTPFDMPEAESELVSGFCTEYSSMKYALFFLAEYANMIVVSAIAATLFLGGWYGPLPSSLGVINLLGKIVAFMFFFIWLRATLPRVRYDQLMRMGWKVLLPLALANVVVTGFVVVLLQ
ncbi:MAG: NADH-quinone oxidoreductase subunit NuoH [Deltaproteobacteria bacterium]|jgi:NADH-quinone oxidoreductase subunit H|nr:NADH-quinone oxidoreductase subunit NuoH [Deltaproteobacteria bacterium]MBW2477382.1 NADH-quinone oxidoreductase subunit NuoH [Deltaproteobacteria bacterium]MBW2504616.1 NADH-quinone oxidoreductase subunit NuoH [Deltaproteobacteria bacterium]MBW2519299.1 NADH-quinone oxidoreductase subunit NuoH [Deltaproteobacteria bacterium]